MNFDELSSTNIVVTEKIKQDHAERVDVRLEAVGSLLLIILTVLLRRSEAQSTNSSRHLFDHSTLGERIRCLLLHQRLCRLVLLLNVRSDTFSQAEVTQSNIEIMVEEDVLWLDVTVDSVT